jgi:hypothetical protein
MMNESSIYFFPGGGHNHDGNNSSLINTSAYSIFDFDFGNIGGPNRVYRQELNQNGFKQFIIATVNSSILEPSGLVLQPGVVNGNAHIIAGSVTGNEIAANTITANNIVAGTITANLLSANIVLIDNVIRSNNFDGTVASNGIISNIGTVGWAITWAGDAVFDSSVIRGAIQADTLFIDGNNYWNGDEIVIGGQGDGIDTVNGYVYIGSDVEIDGNVQVANIYIDNLNYWEPGIFQVGINANNRITFSNNVLEVTGIVTATAGAIGNWDIVGGDLVGLSANGYATMTISASNGGTIQAGNLLIGNNDLLAEDIVATNIARIGSTTASLAIDLIRQGIYYSNTATYFGNPNHAWSFRYNGTNVYAVLWTGTNYIDICLTNCGSTPTPVSPPVGSPPVGSPPVGEPPVGEPPVGEPPVVGVSPEPVCSPPCPEGFICLEGNLCIG